MAWDRDAVRQRLTAIMAEWELDNYGQLGRLCGGASATAVSNWMQGYNLPKVPEMVALCEETGITLDWLYRGSMGAMDPKLAMRLNKHIKK